MKLNLNLTNVSMKDYKFNDPGLAVDFPMQQTLPFFCSPDVIQKFPYSIFYCAAYLIGCAIVMAFGFYMYFKRNLKLQLRRNGYNINRQDTKKESDNSTELRGMLRSGSNSESSKFEIPIFDGSQRIAI
jgi:hypothetical protein